MENCGKESCLDNIVTVSDFCSGERQCSSSGYDIMDAPEISINNLAAIVNEKYVSGLNLARNIVKMATRQIKNDLIAVLNTNSLITNIQITTYNSSVLNSGIIPSAPLERGITLFKNRSIKGKLKKLIIEKVDIFPETSGDSELLIYDEDYVYRYSIQLIAGQINTFQIDHVVSGFFARVLIDTTNLDVHSTRLMCKTGCSGSYVNPCGYVESFDGISENRTEEGYGLNVFFSCQCDYDEFMCDLSQSYVGELIYLKSRIMLLDEHLRTNRFNDWVIYNREDTAAYKAELQQEYVDRWNALVQGMYGILKNYRDDCITCRGIQWVVNG